MKLDKINISKIYFYFNPSNIVHIIYPKHETDLTRRHLFIELIAYG